MDEALVQDAEYDIHRTTARVRTLVGHDDWNAAAVPWNAVMS